MQITLDRETDPLDIGDLTKKIMDQRVVSRTELENSGFELITDLNTWKKHIPINGHAAYLFGNTIYLFVPMNPRVYEQGALRMESRFILNENYKEII